MTDIFEQDKARILGNLQLDAAIVERARQDAQIQAAIKIERERQAEALRRAEAFAAEAQTIAQADAATIEKLAALKDFYTQRQALARLAIESIASLWRIEQEIRAGLSDADRIASSVDMLIEPTQRGARRAALRERAGLPSQHVYKPDVKLANDAQRVGAAAVAALTASIILPGRIETPREAIDFGFD